MQFPVAITADDALKLGASAERIKIVRIHGAGFINNQVPDVLSIYRVLREWRARKRRKGGEQIDGTQHVRGCRPGFDPVGIAHDAGATRAAIKARSLGLAKRRSAGMIAIGGPGT